MIEDLYLQIEPLVRKIQLEHPATFKRAVSMDFTHMVNCAIDAENQFKARENADFLVSICHILFRCLAMPIKAGVDVDQFKAAWDIAMGEIDVPVYGNKRDATLGQQAYMHKHRIVSFVQMTLARQYMLMDSSTGLPLGPIGYQTPERGVLAEELNKIDYILKAKELDEIIREIKNTRTDSSPG